MREAYCGTIAYQFEHLSSHQQRIWLREMIETGAHRQPLADDEKRRLLERLIDVFQFERFLEKAYLGQKMFSIEGLDVVVPMLDELVTLAHRGGAEEVVFGMAHRGRLSVLAHNLGRSVESILAEFEGSKQIDAVKAVAGDPPRRHRRRQVPLRPPGRLRDQRGREDRRPPLPQPEPPRVRRPGGRPAAPASSSPTSRAPSSSHDPKRAVPVLLHGDAAFPGQGVVAETLNLQALKGYTHRRHDPHHPEQPGRLHHRPRGRPLDPLRRRHGEGLQRPDRPRQRRRRRGLLGGGAAGDGLPRALGPRHRHRRDRLPPLRPQRDRRARLHAADDGGQDQGPPAGLRDLRREADRARASSAAEEVEHASEAAPRRDVGGAQGPAPEDGAGRVRGPDRDHDSAPANSTAAPARRSTPRSPPRSCAR